MLASLYIARADTLSGEAKQWKVFGTQIVTFEKLKMTLPQKNGQRINMPLSKLTILVSCCSVGPHNFHVNPMKTSAEYTLAEKSVGNACYSKIKSSSTG